MRALVNRLIEGRVKQRKRGAYSAYVAARKVIMAYGNEDVDIATNGERWLVRQLGQRGLTTVFDVGANVGEWVGDVLAHSDSATVYCYEAIPTTFAELQANVADPRARLINSALSSTPGTLDFNASSLSVVSSVYDVHRFDETLRVTKVQVPATTGDAEAARLGLGRIDLLKVDTEGHDHDVLSGFTGLLAAGRIDVIQFEYNIFTLLARRGLFDFYDLLGERYLLCRLLPTALELMGYERGLDNFAQSNWVCVRKDFVTRELVELLAIRLPEGHRRAIALASLADRPDITKLLG